MTGSSAVDSLVTFMVLIIAIIFFGKFVLRRAGRSVVKVYPTVGPMVFMPPLHPGAFPGQQPYPGMGYPAAHPPAYPVPAHPPTYPTPGYVPAYPAMAEQQRRGIERRPVSDGDQFDEIVRDFYEQR